VLSLVSLTNRSHCPNLPQLSLTSVDSPSAPEHVPRRPRARRDHPLLRPEASPRLRRGDRVPPTRLQAPSRFCVPAIPTTRPRPPTRRGDQSRLRASARGQFVEGNLSALHSRARLAEYDRPSTRPISTSFGRSLATKHTQAKRDTVAKPAGHIRFPQDLVSRSISWCDSSPISGAPPSAAAAVS
jgi:hypothetical protein